MIRGPWGSSHLELAPCLSPMAQEGCGVWGVQLCPDLQAGVSKPLANLLSPRQEDCTFSVPSGLQIPAPGKSCLTPLIRVPGQSHPCFFWARLQELERRGGSGTNQNQSHRMWSEAWTLETDVAGLEFRLFNLLAVDPGPAT